MKMRDVEMKNKDKELWKRIEKQNVMAFKETWLAKKKCYR